MKIEPGDLCMTVNASRPELKKNEGRLVIAHKYEGTTLYLTNAWRCECLGAPLTDEYGKEFARPLIAAKNLRPIRDQPGTDETLTWKEKELAQ